MTSPTIRIARPGPGNGCRQTISRRQAELLADPAYLVLEQRPQRLDERELQVVRQSADIVVALDVRRAGAAAGLDHVRVERALHEEVDAAPVSPASATTSRAAASKTRMNSRPMILRFSSGSITPASAREEPVGAPRPRSAVTPVAATKSRSTCSRLAEPQQPMVDEHAGELVADRPLHERRGDRGVDPAGQPADHPLAADLGADSRHLLVDDVGLGPLGADSGDVEQEPLAGSACPCRVCSTSGWN